MTIKRSFLTYGTCGLLAGLPCTVRALDEGQGMTEVVVTGSHIRGAAQDAALPVQVIDAGELEKAGAPSMVEILKQLPVSSGVLGEANQFDARSQGTEGAGSINLRGLGRERTLVLFNGRRMAHNGFTEAVDTNLLPIAAIGRIEVLKDGAAATYGSDAVAGVVNFIARERFEGFEIGGDYNHIDGSDGDYSTRLAWGWRGDRTRALLAAGFQHRSELRVLDRDWAFPDFATSPEALWSLAGNPSGFVLRSAANTTTGTLLDPGCAALGGVPTAAASGFPLCAWQVSQFDNLVEEEDRYQIYAQLDRELGASTRLHVEALYAETEVPHWKTSPSYAALQAPPGGVYVVPAANPGVQTFIAQNPVITTTQGLTAPSAALLGGGVLLPGSTFRPYALGGNPLFGAASEGRREYQAARFSASLGGDLGEAATWEVALTYMEQKALRTFRDTVVMRMQRALLGFGGPSCSGTAAGANGCLWFNPFSSAVARNVITGAANPHFTGAGDNDNRELIDWMFPRVYTEITTDLAVVDAVLAGQTGWALAGGKVAWALGAQYRDGGRDLRLDDLSNLALTPCPASVDGGPGCAPGQPPTGALMFLGGNLEQDLQQDVYAVFGELSLPLRAGLEAQLAARFEDYGGGIGSTFDPKASLRWQIADSLALRGSVGTTFRGPQPNQTSPVNLTSLQNIAGQLRAVDVVGDPRLEPERATTFNVGLLLSAGRFNASLDYWNIDFDNPLVTEPVGGLVAALFPNGATGPDRCNDPALAGIQSRFTFNGAVCSAANISRLRVGVVNGSAVRTDGLDLSMRFRQDLPRGELTFGLDGAYVLGYESDPMSVEGVVVSPAFDAVGLLNYQTTVTPLPRWKANAFVEYAHGAHNLRLTTHYIDDYTDQRTLVVNPQLGKRIDDFMTHDLSYRAELPWNVRLIAAVVNLTDEEPPFARLELAYDPFTANALGRVYRIGLSKRFAAD